MFCVGHHLGRCSKDDIWPREHTRLCSQDTGTYETILYKWSKRKARTSGFPCQGRLVSKLCHTHGIFHSFLDKRKWLQCFWKRHCHNQYLLWRCHHFGFVDMSIEYTHSFYPLSILEYERSLKMTPIDFISSLGGLFGLFLGFSLLSFVEVIYWFIVVFGRQILLGK